MKGTRRRVEADLEFEKTHLLLILGAENLEDEVSEETGIQDTEGSYEGGKPKERRCEKRTRKRREPD